MKGNDKKILLEDLYQQFEDIIFLNSIIATELIQITENTAKMVRGEVTQKCKTDHGRIMEKIMEIVGKYSPQRNELIRKHVTGH